MKKTLKNNYLTNEIEGASQGKLVILLYDGAIKFLKFSLKYLEEKDIEKCHNNIRKTENIIYGLMLNINQKAGKLSDNLLKVYEFLLWQLKEANRLKDKEKILSVITLLDSLRNAWSIAVLKNSNADVDVKKSINMSI